MKKQSLKEEKGFSMIEIIITLAIIGLVASSIGAFQSNVFSYSRVFSSGLSAADEARRVLRPFSNEVRSAVPSALGSYPIESASSTSFVFFSDTDNDGTEERIRYFLDNGKFKKGTVVPSGNPLVYNSANEKIVTLVSDITNQSIFQYYDTDYDGTTQPLSTPISILDIRLIKIDLSIDKDPNQYPPAFSVTTQVSFRNLKDNL